MSHRGPYTERVQCATAGCAECAWFEHRTLAERREAHLRRQKHQWRCVRHSQPDDVLSLSNPIRVTTLTVGPLEGCGDVPFFQEAKNGFVHGPGFKAFATDFPTGTTIRIEVTVLAPDARAEGR